MQAAVLSGERDDRTNDLLLLDVTPLSLGIATTLTLTMTLPFPSPSPFAWPLTLTLTLALPPTRHRDDGRRDGRGHPTQHSRAHLAHQGRARPPPPYPYPYPPSHPTPTLPLTPTPTLTKVYTTADDGQTAVNNKVDGGELPLTLTLTLTLTLNRTLTRSTRASGS